MNVARIVGIAIALALASCATTHNGSPGKHPPTDLERRAQFDLNCPSDQLVWTEIVRDITLFKPGTWGVRGCGRQATYIKEASHGIWVLNGAINLAPQAIPAAGSAPQ